MPINYSPTTRAVDFVQYFVWILLFASFIMLIFIFSQLFSSTPSKTLYITGYTLLLIALSTMIGGMWNAQRSIGTDFIEMSPFRKFTSVIPFLLIMVSLAYSIYLFTHYTDAIISGHTSKEYYAYSKISVGILIVQVGTILYWLQQNVKIKPSSQATGRVWGITPSNWFTGSMTLLGTSNVIFVILMAVKLATSTTDGFRSR